MTRKIFSAKPVPPRCDHCHWFKKQCHHQQQQQQQQQHYYCFPRRPPARSDLACHRVVALQTLACRIPSSNTVHVIISRPAGPEQQQVCRNEITQFFGPAWSIGRADGSTIASSLGFAPNHGERPTLDDLLLLLLFLSLLLPRCKQYSTKSCRTIEPLPSLVRMAIFCRWNTPWR
jgi:hypothetical protein